MSISHPSSRDPGMCGEEVADRSQRWWKVSGKYNRTDEHRTHGNCEQHTQDLHELHPGKSQHWGCGGRGGAWGKNPSPSCLAEEILALTAAGRGSQVFSNDVPHSRAGPTLQKQLGNTNCTGSES